MPQIIPALHYLKPIEEKFGAHQGLNADWCTMAWPVGHGLWILDDESPEETVSLVRRVERESEGDAEIVAFLTGLPASCILSQVPGFVNRSRFVAVYSQILAESLEANPSLFRYGLDRVNAVATAMMEGLRIGKAEMGAGVKAACKKLGIKPTYREVEIFLEGSVR